MTTDCCGAKEAMGPDDGGVHTTLCRDCNEECCSGCAAVFDAEDGYGEDGRGVRVYALCVDCHNLREERRQRREARNDSGV